MQVGTIVLYVQPRRFYLCRVWQCVSDCMAMTGNDNWLGLPASTPGYRL